MKQTVIKLPKITEGQFLQQVIDLAHLNHWQVAHFRPAMTSRGYRTPCQADAQGYPDLTMVRTRQLIFAELKRSPQSIVTPTQYEWISSLKDAGATVYLWTPEDWDEIVKVLKWD
jgi:hypothetical protein